MKQGMTIEACAAELERQAKAKRDFIADTRNTMFDPHAAQHGHQPNAFVINGAGHFNVNRHAHQQIATRLRIPQTYYDRMLAESPSLFAENANHWLRNAPAKRLFRTLDGTVRADLSDRYRRLDNWQFAQVALETLNQIDGSMIVESCNVSESRLELKAFFPAVEGEVKVGDVVRSGIRLSNSEVGGGRLLAVPMTMVLACRNGAVYHQDLGIKQIHMGKRLDGGDEGGASEIFSDETLRSDDKTLWLAVRDMVRACADRKHFQPLLEKLREAAGQTFADTPINVVQELANEFDLNEFEHDQVVGHLINEGDFTRWGLSNAVNRMSQDVQSYDRATELEVLAGRIIELPAADWRKLSNASLN